MSSRGIPRRIPGMPPRSRAVAQALLAEAGMDQAIERADVLGIGSAGLAVRGNRDEDGTHTRLTLADGSSAIYREYATTSRTGDLHLRKEASVMDALRGEGLPIPEILAKVNKGMGSDRDPAAMLLTDRGGEPLEEVFRDSPPHQRESLWSEVGVHLRRLHSLPISSVAILRDPSYERPWTRTVPYIKKSLRNVKKARPDLAEPVEGLIALLGPFEEYLDPRAKSVCFGGYYLPGMMMAPEGDRFSCTSWLSLGYYVSISDPERDVLSLDLHHREWLGQGLPDSFFEAYGARPNPISDLLYRTVRQVPRAVAYQNPNSGLMRKGFGPPPHSTAIDELRQLPITLDRLKALLSRA